MKNSIFRIIIPVVIIALFLTAATHANDSWLGIESETESSWVGIDAEPTDSFMGAILDTDEAEFVELAGILAKQQETICIDGVCYPVNNVVTDSFVGETTVTTSEPLTTVTTTTLPPQTIVAQSDGMVTVQCTRCGRLRTRIRNGVNSFGATYGATFNTMSGGVLYSNSGKPFARGYGLFGLRARPLFWRFR